MIYQVQKHCLCIISKNCDTKALLNRFNNSSNMTKMPCCMKHWIRLTERKNSKKRKSHIGWRKIVLDENLIAGKFLIQHFLRLIQHNFHVGSVYALFHPTFHSYDVISNVTTSNFEWFNNTKTLCKIMAIKKSHTSNQNSLLVFLVER